MLRRLALALLWMTSAAHAVIIRGHVTTPLGVPLSGARIQLILGPRSVADGVSGVNGEYEIRTDLTGRFVLLTSASLNAAAPALQIGNPFYGGRTDLITIDIALDPSLVTPQLSGLTTLRETPLPELAAPVTQLAPDQLLTQAGVLPDLRQIPSAVLTEYGQTGAPAIFYLRGAAPAATRIDHVSAESLGGAFNHASVGVTGLSSLGTRPAVEITPDPAPLLLTDNSAGAILYATSRAASLRPVLTYTGDAGPLGTYRNEAVATLARGRADLLAAYGRFDTSNDDAPLLGPSPFHTATYVTQLGYHISAATSLRFTLRDEYTAGKLPLPYELFRIAPTGRLADQNLYSGLTFDTRTAREWHNVLRAGLARKREQAFNYSTPGALASVTVTGANGVSATGTPAYPQLAPRQDLITNRDEYSYETDYPFLQRLKYSLAGAFTARYQDERAAVDTSPSGVNPALRRSVEPTHVSLAAALQGDLRHRLFVQLSGSFDHANTYGNIGSPSLGLTYTPVRPGMARRRGLRRVLLQGTVLHATAGTGSRELSFFELASIPNGSAPRSRTFDASVEQHLLAQKLTVRAGYFHSQYTHETEPTAVGAAPFFTPTYSQTLALRTQGLEAGMHYQPYPRLSLDAGYTYLAALVERSATQAAFNPARPGTPIGALSALAGQRPFQRPPHNAQFAIQYTGAHVSASFRGAYVSRSDDSTASLAAPPVANLLLPNRNLSPAYTALDANVAWNVLQHLTVFTQLTNLTDNRHAAPIGFTSTPFLIRTGLRIRFGRE